RGRGAGRAAGGDGAAGSDRPVREGCGVSEFICRLIDDLDAGRIRKDACKAAIYAIVRQTRESAEKGVPVQTYGHYFRDVSHLQAIDVYRVLRLFGVTDPCLQHATKK